VGERGTKMIRLTIMEFISALLIVPLVLVCSIHTTACAQLSPNNCEPMWSSYLPNAKKLQREEGSLFIGFLDANQLVVSYVKPDKDDGSSKNSLQFAGYDRVVSVLNAGTGELTLSHHWRVHRGTSSVYLGEGGILLRAGSRLAFYSKDLSTIRSIELSNANRDGQWSIAVSPTGKTFLLRHATGRGSTIEIRDGTTFLPRKSWTQDSELIDGFYTISDQAIVRADPPQRRILVSGFGKSAWQPITSQYQPGCINSPTLVNDSMLVSDICNSVALLKISGEILMTDHPGKGETVEATHSAVARNGEIFAVSLVKGKGGGTFDTDVHRTHESVDIYSIESKTRIADVEITTPASEHQFAISPDGTRLATYVNGMVSEYMLPRWSASCEPMH
jgi:hypothetical protein